MKKQTSDKSENQKLKSTRPTSVKKRSAFQPPSRTRKGMMIGALVPSVTKPAFKRKSPLFMRLILDWDSIVGPSMAQQSEPCRLRPGVLTLRCSGPMAMEIQYAIPQLLERINTACGLSGDGAIQQIKLVQDRKIVAARPLIKKAASPTPVPLPEMEEGPLRDALEHLGGQIAAHSKHRRS